MGIDANRRPRYDAFISYSHTPRSAAIAEDLQSGLRRFARPWYRARAARVFRDTTDLAASPQLWGDIQAALADSAWFILIASPEAAASQWVRREIQWWLANRSAERLIIVVADGVLRWDRTANRFDAASTAVSDDLLAAFAQEPLWIDLTARGAEPERPTPAVLEHGVASVAARLRGVSLDEIFGEHVRQRRRIRVTVTLVMTILIVLAGGAVAASIVALRQRDEAVAAADRAASHNLVLQSTALRPGQVDRALLTGVGAVALHDNPQARANLITTLVGSRYAGTLPGPVDPVTTVRFAPTGRLAVTAHASGFSRIWDVADPARARLASTIDPTDGAVYMAAFHPAAPVLALGTGTTASLYDIGDITRPRRIATLPEQYGGVRALTFDRTGDRLYTGGNNVYGVDGEGVRAWDVSDPEQPGEVGLLPLAAFTLDLTVSPSGRVLAVAGHNGVTLWSTDGLAQLATITAHRDTVYTAAFSPDGRTMVTGSQDRRVLVWDVSEPTAPRQLADLPEFDKPVFACEISGDGRTLAVGVGDGTVATWNIEDPARPAPVARLPGHADIVDTVAFSADSALILSGAGDGRALVWQTADPTAPVRGQRIDVGTGPVTSVALGSRDSLLALSVASPLAARGPTSLRLHRLDDLATGVELEELPYGSGYQVVSFSPDGTTLVSANHGDGRSTLWNVGDGNRPVQAGSVTVPGLFVEDVSWSADGATLMLAGHRSGSAPGGALTLWDVSDPAGARQIALGGFDGRGPNAAAMSADARSIALATGTLAEALTLWDISDPARPALVNDRVGLHPAVIRAVAFSPRGGVVATGANDQTVALWRLPGGERLAVLDGHEREARQVAFTPDATMLAVLDGGGDVVVWDVAEPTLPVRLHVIPDDAGVATSFALTADGHGLVVGRTGGEVELWDIGRIRDIVTDPVRVACSLIGRGLTEAEWRVYVPERAFRPTC